MNRILEENIQRIFYLNQNPPPHYPQYNHHQPHLPSQLHYHNQSLMGWPFLDEIKAINRIHNHNHHHQRQQEQGIYDSIFNSQNVQWCLWVQQQQQHQAEVQNILKRYDNYLAAAIESCLQFRSLSFPDAILKNPLNGEHLLLNDSDKKSIQPDTKTSFCSNVTNKSSEDCVDLNNNDNDTEMKNQFKNDQSVSFRCDWPGCDQTFQTEQILNHHRRFHIRKSNYQCQHCRLRLLNQKELSDHLLKCDQHTKPKVENEKAPEIKQEKPINTATKNGFLDDAMSEDRKTLIDQLISPKNSKNRELKRALLAVKTLQHRSSTSEANDQNNDESDQSNESYKRTRYSGIGRYRCPWPDCTYTPHFLRDLRRHMFKHTGNKRYKCPECRFDSVWKTSLLQHRRKKHHLTSNSS